MLWLVGECAHVFGPDIHQMPGMMRAIGQPGPDPAAPLDQIDTLARLAAPEQVDGGHDPAEAGADDGDPAAFACHC